MMHGRERNKYLLVGSLEYLRALRSKYGADHPMCELAEANLAIRFKFRHGSIRRPSVYSEKN